jgi:glutamate/tyrosine decarboxylase-like PLP-dependent enzyme
LTDEDCAAGWLAYFGRYRTIPASRLRFSRLQRIDRSAAVETDAAALLKQAADYAATYLETLDARPIRSAVTLEELRGRLAKPFPEAGLDPGQVIRDLVIDAEDGILGSGNARFFGWVIGGTLPVALAADWLTSTWDQNAASNATAPSEAIVEEIAGGWSKQLLNIPERASFAFVTGTQMGHATALAAARHRLLRDRGWNVEELGLAGAPRLRILTTESRHESLLRAARFVGIGTQSIEIVASDNAGQMEVGALEAALRRAPEAPTIVSLQAGDLNAGTFDPFARLCPIAHAAKAWVHIDGAFGLWVATSPRHRHLLDGAELADSWVTDGHKWLNLPFDSGLVFVADAAAHSAAFSQITSYSVPVGGLRNQKDWNPEWSRRGRGFPAYAAMRALGRTGIGELVERCCAHARRLVHGIGALPGAEIVADPIINQGLVRFLARDGDHDRRTDRVIARVQEKGVAWFGGATWRGVRVMRVSVCNWQTSERDVERSIASVGEALAELGG